MFYRLPMLRRERNTSAAAAVSAAGVGLTLAAVGVQTLLHLLNTLTMQLVMLDVNEEHGVFAWASSGTVFVAAATCLALAATGAARPSLLVPLAGLLAFLSLDEAVAIHERIGAKAVSALGLATSWDSVVWPVIYLPIALGVAALLLLSSRTAPLQLRRLILLGLALLAAAVAAEVVSAPLSTPSTSAGLGHALEGALEEGLELTGWGLTATALLGWLASLQRLDPHESAL